MSSVLYLSIILTASAVAQGETPEGTSRNAADSCYPVVGCFSNLPPWTTPVRPAMPPQHPANVTTGMYYFSRDLPKGIRFSIYPEVNLTNIPFDSNKSTFMIFYGFEGNISSPWVGHLKDALLEKFDAEIFIPDYNMANQSYEQSAGNIRVITKLSLLVIDALGADPANLHLIGFCCGSHISGYIGKALKDSALEPRKRLFLWQESAVRLMPDDADFVDVIHSDVTSPKMSPPTGHIDFYFIVGERKIFMPEGEIPRAYDYFIEAVENNCFMGQPAKIEWDKEGKPQRVVVTSETPACKNQTCVAVGFDSIKTEARGVFAVFTNPTSPYCVPQEKRDF